MHRKPKGWLSRHDDGRHFLAYSGKRMQPKKWRDHLKFKKNVPKEVKSEEIDPAVAKELQAPHADPEIVAGTSMDITQAKGEPFVSFGKLKISTKSIDLMKSSAKIRNQPFKIVLMSQKEFLSRTPSTLSADFPASVQKRRHFDRQSLAHAKHAIQRGEVIDIALLDYSRPKAGWATHDARHRARAMLELGIPRMAVAIIGEKEIRV